MGNYQIEARYKDNRHNNYGIIIQDGPDEFVVCGIGLRLKFRPKNAGEVALVSRVLEGQFRQNKWETIRLLNGDESGSDYTADIPGMEKDALESPGIYKVSVITLKQP
jgi:hypothetical protein